MKGFSTKQFSFFCYEEPVDFLRAQLSFQFLYDADPLAQLSVAISCLCKMLAKLRRSTLWTGSSGWL